MTQAEARVRNRIGMHGGYQIATVPGPQNSTLRFYVVRRTVVILQVHANDSGVSLFVDDTAPDIDRLEGVIDHIAQGGA